MNITADTNVLVRAIVEDDGAQSAFAQKTLGAAQLVAVTLPALCELVWVLARGYEIPAERIAAAIRRLTRVENIAMDRATTEAGLAMLDAGGDFADGVIAHEGRLLGGTVLVSFDQHAVQLLGESATLAG
jgi:predicted nucleic-acid-binding protein